MPKSVPPSIEEVAFDCPYCGAYTTHTWLDAYAERRKNDDRAPGVIDPGICDRIKKETELSPEQRERLCEYFAKLLTGAVVVERKQSGTYYIDYRVGNVHLSQCFHCGEVAVWVNQQVMFPHLAEGPPPNADLPEGVLAEYREASRTLAVSPRGAAALLRLAIQKLCKELGEKGNKIDDDIASLVKKGLSPLVQQALDAVRVIGNEAVHPGTLDLKDDVDAARRLFDLVNIIAEQMISNPKHVREIYTRLPEAKRKAIEKRDGTATTTAHE
jgi:hypothetical protein